MITPPVRTHPMYKRPITDILKYVAEASLHFLHICKLYEYRCIVKLKKEYTGRSQDARPKPNAGSRAKTLSAPAPRRPFGPARLHVRTRRSLKPRST